MCIIIATQPGFKVSRQTLKNAVSNNPDGNGIIVIDRGGHVHAAKGLTAKQAIKAMTTAATDSLRVMHARIATSGGGGDRMTHPFSSPSGRYLLMHNGVLHGKYEGKARRSDTALLADALDGLMTRSDYRSRLEDIAVYNSSRLFIVDTQTATPYYFGAWHWDEGALVSNTYGARAPQLARQVSANYWDSLYRYDAAIDAWTTMDPAAGTRTATLTHTSGRKELIAF